MEACLIRMSVAVAAEIQALKLSSDEARRLARFELGRYAAHALMMPYAAFQAAAARDPLRHRRAALALRRLLRAGGEPADHAAAPRRVGHSVLHAGGRQCRPPLPQGGRARLSAKPLRRRLSEAAGACRLRPARPDLCRSGRNAGRRGIPDASPARWKGRRAPSTSGRAAPRCFLAATSAFKRRDRLWRGASGRCRPARPASRRSLRRRRSGPPAGSASASAALPAPSRR